MKLQDACIAEVGDYIGSFSKIGYEMDQTASFKYESDITGSDTVSLASGSAGAWKATSLVALNESLFFIK